jgi:hypothetical protein
MAIDAAKLDELPGRFVTDTGGTGHGTHPTDRIQVQRGHGPSTQPTAPSRSHGPSSGAGPSPAGCTAWAPSSLTGSHRLGSFASNSHRACRS